MQPVVALNILQLRVAESISLYLNVKNQNNPTWIGFGISETGHMLGSDIVSVSYVGGQFYVDDRYVPWAASPLLTAPIPFPEADNHNDWTLICADITNSSISAIVSRALDTGDDQDRVFESGVSLPVIYAFGSTVVRVAYHGGTNRGTDSIQFYGDVTPYPPADADGSIVLQYYPGFITNGLITNYVCQSFDMGSELRQILAVEVFYNGSTLANSLNHHILLHDFTNIPDYSNYNITVPCGTQDPTTEGYSLLGSGNTLIAAWALGGTPLILPSEAGIFVGEYQTFKRRYFIMEMHINNPNGLVDVNMENIGLKIYTTTSYRPYDATTITVGDHTVNFPDIPIGDLVSRESTCPGVCTANLLGPVYIYASFLHMHAVGRQMYSLIHRASDSSEVAIIEKRQFWNNGFQVMTAVNEVLYPGDEISTHCVYDTSKQSIPVTFGSSSYNEMCIHFLFVYSAYNVNGIYFCGYLDPYYTSCGPNPGYAFQYANPQTDGIDAIPLEYQFGIGGPTFSPTNEPTYSPTNFIANTIQYSSFGNAFKISVSICGAALLALILFLLYNYFKTKSIPFHKVPHSEPIEVRKIESLDSKNIPDDFEMVQKSQDDVYS
eukprot:gene22045-28538_t